MRIRVNLENQPYQGYRRYYQYYNKVFRKKSGEERKILQLPIKVPSEDKRISFGNQIFYIDDKKKYKYLLRNLAQHRNVKEHTLIWEDKPLHHKIVASKPIDIYEKFIESNGVKIGKMWVIGSRENGVQIDIFNHHHMDRYTKIHAVVNANDVLIIIHRNPDLR